MSRSCSAALVATIPRSNVSRYRPPAQSSGAPPASVTFPPASSTMITPAAWSQIFSLYPAFGNFMKTSASARATLPYFTCEYTLSGFDAIPRLSATDAVNPCELFAFMTGSQNFALTGSNASDTVTGVGAALILASHGSTVHPRPFTAAKMQPLYHPTDSPASIFVTIDGENPYVYDESYSKTSPVLGMFGHPITPTLRSPSSMSANAIAYWSPRTNPSVPSTGSKIQWRPFPPFPPPLLIAATISVEDSVGAASPLCFASVLFTSAVIFSSVCAPPSPPSVSASASSSPTIVKSGHSCWIRHAMIACAA
mmetsp:Transcript_10187/g.36907  ORF Transcript_10187/g.36907 Transcript_10187/m.36907 type:complete len:310 (-) Transcript_10187:319-1248(-)